MDPTNSSLLLYSLESQLSQLHKLKRSTTDQYIKSMIFYSNIEHTIQSIINNPESLQPSDKLFETTNPIEIMATLNNGGHNSTDYQGILIEKGPCPYDIPLAASDASLSFYNDRRVVTAASFFGSNSTLNIAIPTFDCMTSTELPEITGILLTLQQALANNLSHLHIIVDNQSAMRFIKEAACLGLNNSELLQRKILTNTVYKQKLNEANSLFPHFSYLSISHSKSHTHSTHLYSIMNAGADTLAKDCAKAFVESMTRLEKNSGPSPLQAAPPPPPHS